MSKKKKQQLEKTLVEKILDQQKIAYRQVSYETEFDHGVAQVNNTSLNKNEDLVYKTLVTEGKKTGPVVGVVPLSGHLSLKKLAKVSGNKKVEMIPLKQLEKTTGYVHGANTPIGIFHTHHFPIYLDESMQEHDEICVSSGKIGRSIYLKPADLAKVCQAKFYDLQEEKPES
ncbi:MAG: Cys-tRNA(Pro) deacylase [Lactobacillus sp.]|nr:Cys-tRNA(Pro) deacylase [Lactobacillus sp.]